MTKIVMKMNWNLKIITILFSQKKMMRRTLKKRKVMKKQMMTKRLKPSRRKLSSV
jgi:hypothetical protein